MFTFVSFHKFHLGISNLVKNCSLSFVGSATFFTKENRDARGIKSFVRFNGSILGACNAFLRPVRIFQ